MRRVIIITATVVLTLALTIMAAGCVSEEEVVKEVTVGNKNFTEQYIIGEMIKQLLEDRGFAVELVADLSTMALRQGMEAGDIDICADYTGTAWMTHLGNMYEPGINNNELYELVKEEDTGFVWLDPIWNNNTYVLVSWTEFVEENGIATLSDLAALYQEKEGKIKTFVGTSENALFIQIWTALIAMLLIKFLQFRSKLGWSLSNLIAFLRWNLFTYRNLWEWIDDPFDVPPIEPNPVQYQLPFPGFGQQTT